MELLNRRQVSSAMRHASTPKGGQASIKYPVLLVICCLIFFWPFVLEGKIPIPADTIVGMYHPFRDVVWDDFTSGVPFKNYLITDPVRQQYPWKKLAIEQYKKLKFPLWNPYTHLGMPLLANFQSGVFYPLNFIFFLLPFSLAWGVYIFLQPVLAGLFMYWFLKNFKLKSLACFLGGLVFSFGGFATGWLEWGNIGHTILWLPLILLSIDKLISGKKKLWRFVFLFSLISQFFAGHLQISFYVVIFGSVYLFFRLFSIKKKINKIKFFSLFTFCFLLFTLITAVQWLPTLELIQNSAREIDQSQVLQRGDWFLPFQHLVQLVVPDFFGNPTTANYWGEWNYGEFVSFIGVIPLFFVLLSIFRFKKNNLLKFFLTSALVFLSFALPTPWAKLPFVANIPFINSAQPSRLLSLVDFSLAVLAAFGFDFFLNNNKFSKKEIILSFGFIFLSIGSLWFFVFQAANFYPNANWSINLAISKRNLILPTIVFLTGCFLVGLSMFVRNSLYKKILLISIVILAFLDFLRFFSKFIPFSQKEWIFPQTKTIEFLKKDKSLYRFLSVDRRLFPANFAIAYDLQTISGYDPLYLKDYARLITRIESGQDDIASFNRIVEPANYNSEIADSLNVKYVLSLQELNSEKLIKVFQEGQTRVYENLRVRPRVSLLSSLQGRVELLEYEPNRIKIEVESNSEQDLVLADMYYPGWQARVNGKKVLVEKTKENFRKINLAKGRNIIGMFYFPNSFKVGLFLSLTGLLLFFYFFVSKNKLFGL